VIEPRPLHSCRFSVSSVLLPPVQSKCNPVPVKTRQPSWATLNFPPCSPFANHHIGPAIGHSQRRLKRPALNHQHRSWGRDVDPVWSDVVGGPVTGIFPAALMECLRRPLWWLDEAKDCVMIAWSGDFYACPSLPNPVPTTQTQKTFGAASSSPHASRPADQDHEYSNPSRTGSTPLSSSCSGVTKRMAYRSSKSMSISFCTRLSECNVSIQTVSSSR